MFFFKFVVLYTFQTLSEIVKYFQLLSSVITDVGQILLYIKLINQIARLNISNAVYR